MSGLPAWALVLAVLLCAVHLVQWRPGWGERDPRWGLTGFLLGGIAILGGLDIGGLLL